MLPNHTEPSPWAANGVARDLDDEFEDDLEDGFERGAERRDARDRLRAVDRWDPPQRLWRRALRAVHVPRLAGIVVFLLAIALACGIVWSQSHTPTGDAADVQAAGDGLASSASAERDDTAGVAEGAAAAGSGAAAPEAAGGAIQVFVHVVGEVRSPGVFELTAGSRVRDAVEAAGGATADGVLAGVNLARLAVDGEQIVVPDAAQVALGEVGVAGDGGSGAAGVVPGGVVDLNAADATQLESLPGIGPAIADRIVTWRTTNGRFTSIDQLVNVPGIGTKTLDGFRDRVRVS